MVIDVEALISSGNKNSVTTKTMEAMSVDQRKDVIGTAEKTLVTIAKKLFRTQAMKVLCIHHTYTNREN
jgi:hypothetical protein